MVINYNRILGSAEEALRNVEAAGRRRLIVKADLSDSTQVRNLIATGIEHFGRLDILVNNAGIETHTPFWDVTEEDYDRVLNVNLKGVFFATQAIVCHFLATKRPGKTINISSVHEDLPFPNFAAYCASKGGLKMLTRNLSVELGQCGITINSLAPGAIETPIDILRGWWAHVELLGAVARRRYSSRWHVATSAITLSRPANGTAQ